MAFQEEESPTDFALLIYVVKAFSWSFISVLTFFKFEAIALLRLDHVEYVLPIVLSKLEILRSIREIRISTSSNVFLVSFASLEEEFPPPDPPEPPPEDLPEPPPDFLELDFLLLLVETLALVAPFLEPLE